jgi:hypothetical protein
VTLIAQLGLRFRQGGNRVTPEFRKVINRGIVLLAGGEAEKFTGKYNRIGMSFDRNVFNKLSQTLMMKLSE